MDGQDSHSSENEWRRRGREGEIDEVGDAVEEGSRERGDTLQSHYGGAEGREVVGENSCVHVQNLSDRVSH